MSLDVSNELKHLQSQRDRINGELKQARSDQKEVNERVKSLESKLRKAEARINTLIEQTKDPTVSEHAILRYLERVKGIDMEQVIREILSETVRGQIVHCGSGTYPIGNGFKLRVRKNVVTTVLSPEDN